MYRVFAPNKDSRQRRGEGMFAFILREQEYARERMTKESQRAREKREKRAEEEMRRPFPTKKGPTVFHWVKVCGHWLREVVWSTRYEALWKDTTEHHRIYNSVRNEWDVSRLFAPESDCAVDDLYEGWDMYIPNPGAEDESDDDDDG